MLNILVNYVPGSGKSDPSPVLSRARSPPFLGPRFPLGPRAEARGPRGGGGGDFFFGKREVFPGFSPPPTPCIPMGIKLYSPGINMLVFS